MLKQKTASLLPAVYFLKRIIEKDAYKVKLNEFLLIDQNEAKLKTYLRLFNSSTEISRVSEIF